MNRCLPMVNAVLVALCCALPLMPGAAQAEPVVISTQGLPGIDIAQRDSAGTLRLFDAEDVDGDGMMSLVADLEPLPSQSSVYVHIKSGPSQSNSACLVTFNTSNPGVSHLPFFITGTEERVITQWISLPTVPSTLGEPFSVAGGQIVGFDAVLYRSPGIASAADVVNLNLTTLPLYTGPAQVGGLVQFQVIPEPSTLALTAVPVAVLVLQRLRRRPGILGFASRYWQR